MKLTRNEILEKLKNILLDAGEADPAKVTSCTEETLLREDFGFSSVSLLYMVIAIEESFGIRFDDASLGDFVTMKDVVDYIEGKLK